MEYINKSDIKKNGNLVLSTDLLVHELYEIGAIQFGSFTLKNGSISPIYIDMRRIISYPKIMKLCAASLWQIIALQSISFDFLCAVPYGAIPIASSLSILHEKPLLMARKQTKDHGTKRAIEGVYKSGDSVVLIEDVITSGSSII